MHRNGYVYIVTNKKNGTLYLGVTSNLLQRIRQHKTGAYEGFTKKYDLKTLVYFEKYDLVIDAIAREKRLKGGSRRAKIDLINEINPDWNDLAANRYQYFE